MGLEAAEFFPSAICTASLMIRPLVAGSRLARIRTGSTSRPFAISARCEAAPEASRNNCGSASHSPATHRAHARAPARDPRERLRQVRVRAWQAVRICEQPTGCCVLCGIVDEPALPGAAGSSASPTSVLRQQGNVGAICLPRRSRYLSATATGRDAIPFAVPRRVRHFELESLPGALATAVPLLQARRECPLRHQLQDVQQPLLLLPTAHRVLASIAVQRAHSVQGDRQRLLKQCVLPSASAMTPARTASDLIARSRSRRSNSSASRIASTVAVSDDVLARCAPVDEARSILVTLCDSRCGALTRGIATLPTLRAPLEMASMSKRAGLHARPARGQRRCAGSRQPHPRRARVLLRDREHSPQGRAVREQRAHIARGEHGAEESRGIDHWESMSGFATLRPLDRRSPSPCALWPDAG